MSFYVNHTTHKNIEYLRLQKLTYGCTEKQQQQQKNVVSWGILIIYVVPKVVPKYPFWLSSLYFLFRRTNTNFYVVKQVSQIFYMASFLLLYFFLFLILQFVLVTLFLDKIFLIDNLLFFMTQKSNTWGFFSVFFGLFNRFSLYLIQIRILFFNYYLIDD